MVRPRASTALALITTTTTLMAACSLLAPSAEQLSGDDELDAASPPADAPTTCPPGTKRCDDHCVSIASPATGCGGPSCTPCRFDHAAALCIDDVCAPGPCENGFANCNARPDDGCEVDTRTASAFCGSCLVTCSGDSPLCVESTCVPRCHAVKLTTTTAAIRFAEVGLDVGTGDFTLETWARKHSDFVSSGGSIIATNADYWTQAIAIRWSPTEILCDITGTTTTPELPVGPVPTDKEWHHFACSRESSVLRLFIDGVLVASMTSNHALAALSPGVIGAYYAQPAMPVFVGSTRISRRARYTGAFQPRWHWPVDDATTLQFLVTTSFDGAGIADEAGGNNQANADGGVTAADEEAPCQ